MARDRSERAARGIRRQVVLMAAGVAVGAMVTGGSIALADAGGPPSAGYVSITPVKIASAASVSAGKVLSPVAMGGSTTVPTNATAVRLSVTVRSTKPGTLLVYPAGDPTAAGATSMPITSTATTQTMTETVGTKDQISFQNTSAAAAVLTVSITGYSTQLTATNLSADGGSAGQVLTNTGSGVSWGSGSLTVNAGSGLSGGGTVPLGGSSTLSVDPAAVQSRVTGTCGAGTAMTSVAQNGSVTCRQTGTKTISGVIGTTGATLAGSGFTAANTATGVYTINFAPGTWNGLSAPVMTVTPFGETSTITSAIVYIETFGGDGSANFTIRVSTTNGTQALTNNSFEFITVQS